MNAEELRELLVDQPGYYPVRVEMPEPDIYLCAGDRIPLHSDVAPYSIAVDGVELAGAPPEVVLRGRHDPAEGWQIDEEWFEEQATEHLAYDLNEIRNEVLAPLTPGEAAYLRREAHDGDLEGAFARLVSRRCDTALNGERDE